MTSILRGHVELLVLSACLSAAPGQTSEANLAALLCAQGLPCVLGMQFPVSDPGTRRLTTTFYHALLRSEPIPEAVRQGRLAVFNDPDIPEDRQYFETGIHVLYTAVPPDRPARLPSGQSVRIVEPSIPKLEGTPHPRKRLLRPPAGTGGDRRTPDRRTAAPGHDVPPLTVTLHGTGSIGKTALLRRAAERFAWNYERVLILSLEPLHILADVLGRLEHALGLPREGGKDETARISQFPDSVYNPQLSTTVSRVGGTR